MDIICLADKNRRFLSIKNTLQNIGINLINTEDINEKINHLQFNITYDKNLGIENIAWRYYSIFNCPILVINTSLCFENLEEIFCNNYIYEFASNLIDESLINDARSIIDKYGYIKARLRDEICFLINENNVFYENIPTEYFTIVDKTQKDSIINKAVSVVSIDEIIDEHFNPIVENEVFFSKATKWRYEMFFKNLIYKLKN